MFSPLACVASTEEGCPALQVVTRSHFDTAYGFGRVFLVASRVDVIHDVLSVHRFRWV